MDAIILVQLLRLLLALPYLLSFLPPMLVLPMVAIQNNTNNNITNAKPPASNSTDEITITTSTKTTQVALFLILPVETFSLLLEQMMSVEQGARLTVLVMYNSGDCTIHAFGIGKTANRTKRARFRESLYPVCSTY